MSIVGQDEIYNSQVFPSKWPHDVRAAVINNL